MLELSQVTKDFPGTRALENVSFSVGAGEVVALMGENGAGKSTLMKILSGIWPVGSYAGEMRLRGVPLQFREARDAHAAGIAMIHQELAVFPELTVAEHLELDRLPRWIRWNDLMERAQGFLDQLGFGLQATQKVGQLSIGGRQLVEIARALHRNAQVIVFDEPTSALTESEVRRLDQIILRLRGEGRAIITITHRMDEVFRLADRMVVLRDGRFAGEISGWSDSARTVRTARAVVEPQLISWMVGRPIESIYPPRAGSVGTEVFKAEGLTLVDARGRTRLHEFGFSVKKGEVLGLAGLLGAGRSESFELLFGTYASSGPRSALHSSARVWMHGKPVALRDPATAIRERVAFVSEDRKGNGLVLSQSILSNLSLPALSANRAGLARGAGLLSFRNTAEERAVAEKLRDRLRIKCASLDQPVGELSGGNQQKVVIAKWLLTEPEVLFLDEPTRGIDIGAKAEIYQLIQELAGQGLAIVVASSEMPELLGLCHRIVVLREGRISAELTGDVDQEQIMRAAAL